MSVPDLCKSVSKVRYAFDLKTTAIVFMLFSVCQTLLSCLQPTHVACLRLVVTLSCLDKRTQITCDQSDFIVDDAIEDEVTLSISRMFSDKYFDNFTLRCILL